MPKEKIKQILSRPEARAVLFLYGGAVFHFLYALYRLLTGILYRRNHMDAAVIFYLSLAANRFSLILAYKRARASDAVDTALSRSGKLLYITVGCMLLLMGETIAGTRRAPYPRFLLLVSGGYAILAAALALLELLYLKRLGSPLLSASRAVGLASAALSSYTFLGDLLYFLKLSPAGREVLLLLLGAVILLFLGFFATALHVGNGLRH